MQAQSGKVNPDQAKQVAPELVSPPGKGEATAGEKKADTGVVSEPVLKPELKAASKPKTKGADGRREEAEARREAAQKVSRPQNVVLLCRANQMLSTVMLPYRHWDVQQR